MYLPYLRGRQYELLALRELLERTLIGDKILPIIEPVKATSTLVRTLELFCANERRIGLIYNPQVGSFSSDLRQNKDIAGKLIELYKTGYVMNTIICNDTLAQVVTQLHALGINKNRMLLVIKDRDYIGQYLEIFKSETPHLSLVPDESSFRRQIRNDRVILDDKFQKKNRNADYLGDDDEFFSEDHLFYHDEGYKGFSDYSIIGADYSESGFAPFAVAIHIVYFSSDDSLRIKHFVSDSNDDISDPANKYSEALAKLNDWVGVKDISTFGLSRFLDHYEKGSYPGLGTVKKLAIMHHIELMSKFLDKGRL